MVRSAEVCFRERRVPRPMAVLSVLVLLVLVAPPSGLCAQELRGLVIEAETGTPIRNAVVQLLDAEDQSRAVAISDSIGRYAIVAPSSGEYRIETEAFGYILTRSHLLGLGQGEEFAVDIELRPAPIALAGFVVTRERFDELSAGVRAVLGVHPTSLRNDVVFRPEIEEHLARGHDVTAFMRWQNLPSIETRETTEGPCFQWRQRHCLPVYLNGFQIPAHLVPALTLEVAEMVLVLGPGETLTYIDGAVLLYTAAWVR